MDTVPVQVGVAVDESRHDRTTSLFHTRRTCLKFGARSKGDNLAILHCDKPVGEYITGHGEYPAGQGDVFSGYVEHGLRDFVVTPCCGFWHAAGSSERRGNGECQKVRTRL